MIARSSRDRFPLSRTELVLGSSKCYKTFTAASWLVFIVNEAWRVLEMRKVDHILTPHFHSEERTLFSFHTRSYFRFNETRHAYLCIGIDAVRQKLEAKRNLRSTSNINKGCSPHPVQCWDTPSPLWAKWKEDAENGMKKSQGRKIKQCDKHIPLSVF